MQFRTVILAVVSSAPQAGEEHYSLDSQVRLCTEACDKYDWQIAETLRFQHSRSYDSLAELTSDSPDFTRFVDIIASKSVNLVVAYKYDRLGRTLFLQMELQRLCKKNQVQIFSVSESIGLPTPPEKFALEEHSFEKQFTNILRGIMAEQEVNKFVDRSREGKLGRARAGLHLGWSRIPYGYKVRTDHAHPLVPDPLEAPWVRAIYEQRAQGAGKMAITLELADKGAPSPGGKEWSTRTTWYILHNPFYAGKIIYNRYTRAKPKRVVFTETFPGKHEPIISQELWDAVQRINRAQAARRAPSTYHLFAGLTRCGFCGHASVYTKQYRTGHEYMSCAWYRSTGGKHCQSNGYPLGILREYVTARVQSVLDDPLAFSEHLAQQRHEDNGQRQIEALRQAIAEVDTRMKRLYDALEKGAFSLQELSRRYDQLAMQKGKAEGELDRLQQRDRGIMQFRDTALALRNTRLENLNNEELKPVLRQLIQAIYLKRDEAPVIAWLC